jgi:hypothetical protein
MARTFPSTLPHWLREDPKHRAEVKVFDRLLELGDEHTVFYRVAWHDGADGRPVRDGEGDFVIAHPDRGILCLEVKGGGIGYDGSTQEWWSIDRTSERHQIKDPVNQAVATQHWLVQTVKASPRWTGGWIAAGHAVVFPDTVVDQQHLKPDLPRDIVIDKTDLGSPVESLERVFDHYADDRAEPFGRKGIGLLESLLASSFELRTPLGAQLDDDVERLVQLTEEQCRLLDYLGNRRRALIKGCAGSGKTMLAIEQARRFADRGYEVLLTCFNEPLAEHLRSVVDDAVAVMHFHGLCEHLTRDHGNAPIKDERSLGDYYESALPEAALQAAEAGTATFDAIVVDEAQDFAEAWWIILQELLTNEESGYLFAFADNNQILYPKRCCVDEVFDEDPYPLTHNCRNTQAIHESVAHYYRGDGSIECDGPPGRPVEVIQFTTEHDLQKKLRQQLHQLITEGKVSHADVVILTPCGVNRTGFPPGTELGNFTLVDGRTSAPNEIRVSSVHRFKGLESKVVLLVEEPKGFTPNLVPVLYIACSRAMTHLVRFSKA